jgi:hypothetical protein
MKIISISLEAANAALASERQNALAEFTGSMAPGGADEAPIFSETVNITITNGSTVEAEWTILDPQPFLEA